MKLKILQSIVFVAIHETENIEMPQSFFCTLKQQHTSAYYPIKS